MKSASLLHLFSSELKKVILHVSARTPLAVGLVCFFCLVATFACVSSTGSMVLMAYGYLCVFDLAMVATILVTLWVKEQQPTPAFSFGYDRFEVVAVFCGTVLAQLGAIFVAKESFEHLLDPHQVHTGRMLLGTTIAFASHLIVIYTLNNSAFNHVIIASSSSWLQEHVADISQTVCRFVPPLSSLLLPRVNPFTLLTWSGAMACVISFFLVEYEQCYTCDTIAAMCLALMIFGSMHPMSLYTGKILLQTTPSHVIGQLDKCRTEASTLDGVLEFTHEHFWQLSFGQLAGSVHVRVRRDADEQLVLAHVTERLSSVVSQLTVQIVKDADWSTLSGGSGMHEHQHSPDSSAPAQIQATVLGDWAHGHTHGSYEWTPGGPPSSLPHSISSPGLSSIVSHKP